MQSPSSLPYPGSRSLAQWWRQLQPSHPTALRVGYCYLHRVEAPVCATITRRLDPLAGLVLRALEMGDDLPRLGARLHLPAAVVRRVLAGLEADTLVRPAAPAVWTLTEQGRGALTSADYPTCHADRRVFTFAERFDEHGRRALPPHYLPLAECPAVAWETGDVGNFDPAWLDEAVRQPAPWKQAYHFPADVAHLERDGAGAVCPAAGPAWRRVIVDRPERAFLALTPTADELLGFAVRADSWELLDSVPVLRLPAGARSLWPELSDEPDAAVLREAWLGWCRQRNIPDADARVCPLSLRGEHLDVDATPSVIEELRSARSGVFKGETWLLLGAGPWRTAAALRLRAV